MILIKATRQHLIQAAGNLSRGDLNEFHSNVSGRDPKDVLTQALDETTRAIVVGSMVLAVGGSRGCLWFVTTTAVDHLTKAQRMTFYRMLKGHLEEVRKVTPAYQLTNCVSVDNSLHIRLLDSLGAKWSEAIVMSPAGCAFRQFWL